MQSLRGTFRFSLYFVIYSLPPFSPFVNNKLRNSLKVWQKIRKNANDRIMWGVVVIKHFFEFEISISMPQEFWREWGL